MRTKILTDRENILTHGVQRGFAIYLAKVSNGLADIVVVSNEEETKADTFPQVSYSLSAFYILHFTFTFSSTHRNFVCELADRVVVPDDNETKADIHISQNLKEV